MLWELQDIYLSASSQLRDRRRSLPLGNVTLPYHVVYSLRLFPRFPKTSNSTSNAFREAFLVPSTMSTETFALHRRYRVAQHLFQPHSHHTRAALPSSRAAGTGKLHHITRDRGGRRLADLLYLGEPLRNMRSNGSASVPQDYSSKICITRSPDLTFCSRTGGKSSANPPSLNESLHLIPSHHGYVRNRNILTLKTQK